VRLITWLVLATPLRQIRQLFRLYEPHSSVAIPNINIEPFTGPCVTRCTVYARFGGVIQPPAQPHAAWKVVSGFRESNVVLRRVFPSVPNWAIHSPLRQKNGHQSELHEVIRIFPQSACPHAWPDSQAISRTILDSIHLEPDSEFGLFYSDWYIQIVRLTDYWIREVSPVA
jgi:hypothetical protein